jgi:elongation factor 1-beta
MPESIDVDFVMLKDALRSALPEGARLTAFEERPIAFGLKALVALIILDDRAGGTEVVESAFASVKGVESVEVEEVGLI